WGCNGVGDDFYSYGFDGRRVFFAGRGRVVSPKKLEKGDVVGCALDLNVPEISCRFIFGGDQGRLRFGPPPGFSAVVEAVSGDLQQEFISSVLTGFCHKKFFFFVELFRETLVFFSNIVLHHHANDIHPKFAENLHELWAMRKIELGWSYGETRSETQRKHPCLTSFDRLPTTEKQYNINLALDTLKTIEALGYHLITDTPPTRLRPVRLAQNFQQSNGYKPQPLDTHEITLPEELNPLIEALARNTHNVWAREKIKRGWTFGLNEESAAENLRALQLFGIFIEPPAHEHDEVAEKEMRARKDLTRTYRAEATYAVTTGTWYFEFEILTAGFMKIGWMDVGASPDIQLGHDDRGYAFDGPSELWTAKQLVKILHNMWITRRIRAVLRVSFVVVCMFFSTMYQNMYRSMPMWFAKRQARFEDISAGSQLEISRIPATGNSPPCLKLTQKVAILFQFKTSLRLSLFLFN
ncbi:ryR domain protein, partial [Ancylostoma duodenale]